MNGAPYVKILASNTRCSILLDASDKPKVLGKPLSIDKDGYPSFWHPERGKVTLHRFLLAFPDSEVDHINRDKLDNRRENLRVVTKSVQSQNRSKRKGPSSSQYVGVTKRGETRWTAIIKKDGETYRLGSFRSERDAALAYNGAARALYGMEASTNEV